MKIKNFVILLLLSTGTSTLAQEKRNLLTDHFTRKLVSTSVLSKNQEWIGYPAYKNRAAWQEVPEKVRQEAITAGEKFIGYQWPQITATMYLGFTRTGDRAVVDQALSTRLNALRSLVMAELMEGKGRFMDDIINGVFTYCEQTYWGSSAHFYLYGFEKSVGNPTVVLPDQSDPVIDLMVGDAAADLAWTWHFLREEFDKVSPVIARRLKNELYAKVLLPYYQRNDFWWITGWGEGRVNNWTPWCNYNMLVCMLLLEDDPLKLEDGIYKSMQSVDLFINSYPEDGGCSEGPGYWAPAGGKMFDYLDLLRKASGQKIDIFQQELIRNIGRYIYRAYIGNGVHYVNFADSQARLNHDGGRIYRWGQRIEDPVMQGFGAFLYQKGNPDNRVRGRMGEMLENLFSLEGVGKAQKAEPLIKEYYLSDLDVAFARDREGSNQGFYFAAKGGHNNEQHNHNDVGSFILHYDGKPVLVDVGVGTYTRETFSADRYKIWTMQSDYHNVPFVNGESQRPGRKFAARNSAFHSAKDKAIFSSDIAGAYPEDAGVQTWERSYTLERNKKFLVRDRFVLGKNPGGTRLHFMTVLPAKVTRPGELSLPGDGFDLAMKFQPDLFEASVEEIDIEDPKLLNALPKKVYRIILNMKPSVLKGESSIEISRIK